MVVEPRGPGTRWLAALPPGAPLEVTGPLGRPFSLPKEPARCLLVGEGYAAAPLLAARRAAPRARLRGPAGALRARRGAPARRAGGPSYGRPGRGRHRRPDRRRRAPAAARRRRGLRRRHHPHPARLRRAAAERAGAWSQTALEQPLTCATGLCHGCAVPVVGEDGITHWSAPASTARCSAPVGSTGTCSTGRPRDRLAVRPPGARRLRLRRHRPRARGVRRARCARRLRHPLDHPPRAVRRAGAAARRDPQRARQCDRPAEPRPRAFLATELPVLLELGATRRGQRRRAHAGGVRRGRPRAWAAPRASPRSRSTSRRPTPTCSGVSDVREPFQAAGIVAACRRDLPRGVLLLAKLRTDALRVVETRPRGGRRRRRRRRRRQRAAGRHARRPARAA